MPSSIFKAFFGAFFFLAAGLSALSTEEKVGQLLIVHFRGTEANEEAARLVDEAHVGGFIFFNWANELSSPSQVKALSEGLQKLSPRPLWICIDQEGGPVARLREGFETFPGNREMVLKYKPEEVAWLAAQAASQLKSLGINMNLAPVIDIGGVSSYINNRAFGDTPEVVIDYAKPILESYRKEKVLAVVKHFPGYGGGAVDPHADLPVNSKNLVELMKWELMPYSRLQSDAVMTAHILLPSIDPKWCATLSPQILQGVLRKGVGFHGLVISDSLTMEGVIKQSGSIEEAAIQAVIAGCDLVILGGKQLVDHQKKQELSMDDKLRVYRALLAAVRMGRIPQERLDEAVQHTILLKKFYLKPNSN